MKSCATPPGQPSDGLHLLRLDQLALQVLPFCFRLFARGDVLAHRHTPDGRSCPVTDESRVQSHPDDRAVFADIPFFVVVAGSAALDRTVKDRPVLLPVVRVGQLGEFQRQQFIRRITGDLTVFFVEAKDLAALGNDLHNADGNHLEDGAELFFAGPQRFFRPLVFRDVHMRSDHAEGGSRLVARDHPAARQDPSPGTVFALRRNSVSSVSLLFSKHA